MSSCEPGPTFNLVDQPWIGVRHRSGHTVEMGIVGALTQAHDLAGLAGDIPTQSFAITRLLLAVLHRALDGPADIDTWEQLWAAAQLPAPAIDSYLERWRPRFDLLHPEQPFFQVPGLRTDKGGFFELKRLIADVPNGKPFFTTRLGQRIELSFAEAARWVVHAQAFDPSGIKSGCLGDERVKKGKGYPIGVAWSGLLGGVLLEGATLKETLLLNLIAADQRPFTDADGDLPAWEREPDGPGQRAEEGRGDPRPHGPLDLYTWQSRRIRLDVPASRVGGVLIGNGDRLTPQNRHVVEPHSGWRRSQFEEKKAGAAPVVYMPLEHDPERTIWRGLESMLPRGSRPQTDDAAARLAPLVLDWLAALVLAGVLPLDHMVRVRTIGMIYGSDQHSVTAEVIDDALSLRAVLVGRDQDLAQAAVDCVNAAGAVARTLGALAADLTVASGGEPDGPRRRAVELAYAELDRPFRGWLESLTADTDPTEAQARWHAEAARIVGDLAADLQQRSPLLQAWIGRRARGRLVTASHADAWCCRDLRAALPHAHPGPGPGRLTGGPAMFDPTRPQPTRHRPTQDDVAAHVAAQAGLLQQQARHNVSAGVAALARLRRGVGKPPGEQVDLLVYTYRDAFAPLDEADEPSPEEWASHVALTLFAQHQQSQSAPMHICGGLGLGTALRALGGDGPATEWLLRRFRILGTAQSFLELTYHLQGGVQLLRQGSQPLDYGLLAEQLVRWQRFTDGPSQVRLRWGREFYRTHKRTEIRTELEGADQ